MDHKILPSFVSIQLRKFRLYPPTHKYHLNSFYLPNHLQINFLSYNCPFNLSNTLLFSGKYIYSLEYFLYIVSASAYINAGSCKNSFTISFCNLVPCIPCKLLSESRHRIRADCIRIPA